MRPKAHGQKGRAFVTAAPALPPSKRPRIDVLGVVCPACKAGVRAKCVTTGTGPTGEEPGRETGAHDPRRRMARRAANVARGL